MAPPPVATGAVHDTTEEELLFELPVTPVGAPGVPGKTGTTGPTVMDDPIAPWLARLIRSLPAEGVDAPLEAKETLVA